MPSAAAASQARLDDLLDGIKQEFATFSKEATSSRLQNQKDYDYKINLHLAEMQQIRNTVYELELSHRKMKDSYQEEVNKLKLEIGQKDHQIATLTQQLQQQSPSMVQGQLQQQQQQPQPPQSQPPQPQAQQLPQQSQLPPVVQPPQQIFLPQSQIQQPGVNGVPEQADQQQQAQQLAPQPANGVPPQQTGPALAPLISALGSQLKTPNIPGAATVETTEGTPTQLPQIQPPTNTTPGQEIAPTQLQPLVQAAAPIPAVAPIVEPQTAQPIAETSVATPSAATTEATKTSPVVENATPMTEVPAATSPATTPSGKKKNAAKDATKTEPATTEVAKTEYANYLVAPDQRASQTKAIPPFLLDLDYAQVPDNLKKRENDYYVLYNPALPRNIEIDLHTSLEHSSVVCCVKFSNDGQFLATGCNKTTQVYRVSDGSLVAKLSDDNAPSLQNSNGSGANGTNGKDGENNATSTDLYIRSVCFSPDGKFLATGAEDRLIRIWDIQKQEIVMFLQGHDQDVYSLDYFPSGDKLVSGSGDRTVRIWDLKTGQCSLTLSIEDGVTTVAVSPGDGKYIAAGSLDRAVRVWDSETGFLVERLDSENELGTGHRDSVYSVVFTKDGNKVVSGSLDRSVKLWNLRNAKENGKSNSAVCDVTYIGHKDFVLSVTTTNNDEYVLSGSKDRGVLFWDTDSGNPLLMLQGHRNSVISVAVANGHPLGPDYQVFATGSGDCRARIWKFSKTSNEGKIEEVKS
ncbi:general transcriptional corepressor Tup1p [Monosporozyma unispora]|nr:general transcription repressor [Kazachstania unispora]